MLPASFAAEMSRIRTMPPDRVRSLDPNTSVTSVKFFPHPALQEASVYVLFHL
jgi:hypothetical protein